VFDMPVLKHGYEFAIQKVINIHSQVIEFLNYFIETWLDDLTLRFS